MRLSFSAFETYQWCPYQFKLRYIDRIPFDKGNVYSAFGGSIHSTLEKCIPDRSVDVKETFKFVFKKALKELSYEKKKELFKDKELKLLVEQMFKVAPSLCFQAIQALDEKFGKFSLFGVEIEFKEPLLYEGKKEYQFVGTIDIIIEDENGLYHILDFKTCSWGWEPQHKTDKITTYQLTFYKHFFCLQTNTDTKNVKTHFALLKRTAKKDNIEIFEVPVGDKKIKNALKVLDNMVYNVEQNRFPKVKTDCKYCPFYHTIHCNAK